MHNEFRDTPKTGDDFNLGLWVSLAALSVVGAGVLGFCLLYTSRAVEATAEGKSIFAYDKSGKVAAAYEQLGKDVYKRQV